MTNIGQIAIGMILFSFSAHVPDAKISLAHCHIRDRFVGLKHGIPVDGKDDVAQFYGIYFSFFDLEATGRALGRIQNMVLGQLM